MRHLKILVLMSFVVFSNLRCVSEPKAEPFDAKWFLYEAAPNEKPFACLPLEDVKLLRKKLIECGVKHGD
jgi:hypothetical protein